ncbi:MAG: hypothetical protein GOP50_12365 [Candidatus Heimdallarchaeota archaeon]|nr:hypothetical protein [Candidatus Heimdallarchaeota archaeon]
MASAAITKNIEISKLKLRKEESVFERLQRLTVGATRFHRNGTNVAVKTEISMKSVEKLLNEQKDKALRQALLHVGSINY